MDNMQPRIKEKYKTEIVPQLKEKLSKKNIMSLPKLLKVSLNMGLSEAVADSKVIQSASNDLAAISGQLPVITKARKSIATYKIREGMPLGVKVTLRGNQMYEFIDRLVTVALPRIRDFRGLKKSGFDNSGNYSFGIKEVTIFPEINVDKLEAIRGMDITVCTSAKDNNEAMVLLKELNFPINI
jgi:large subunit ribosomal protein L5